MVASSPHVPQRLAKCIDHTLLRVDARSSDIARCCEEAQSYGFHAVCIQPWFVRVAARHLAAAQSRVNVCTVIGFPHGTSRVKAFETRAALADGTDEIDMVMPLGALLDRQWDVVRDDIATVVRAAEDRLVKVILETAVLTATQIDAACQLVVEAKAHFVKTSTGFGPGGATHFAVARMRSQVGRRIGVKASGGIRDLDSALDMLEAGADRLGTSASVAIVAACRQRARAQTGMP